MIYSPKIMQEKMEEFGFSFKKNFGQNFIIDENIINGIINKAEIDNETLIIEIGPGCGSLTYKLGLSAKNVLCYEIDTKVRDFLEFNIKELNNVSVIYQDFLKANVLSDIKKFEYKKLYVVANLPYYITTPIIIKLIEDKIPVEKIVVMVQKEVGNRFKAKPGSKDYSSLSIYLNYYFDVKKLMEVSRNVFMPKPNVDSIVVEFKKKNEKISVNEDVFFKLIRDSFTQKRKTLRNNLKNYNLTLIENVLKKHNFNLSVRAEQLDINIFIEIANALSDVKEVNND